jgi:hypothetical protein
MEIPRGSGWRVCLAGAGRINVVIAGVKCACRPTSQNGPTPATACVPMLHDSTFTAPKYVRKARVRKAIMCAGHGGLQLASHGVLRRCKTVLDFLRDNG